MSKASKKSIRILVTGNRGYIGSILTALLIEEGYDVIGFDTNYYAKSIFSQETLPLTQVTKDIRHIKKSDLEGVDSILHLAALSNDPLGEVDPKLTLDINFNATVRLAKLAKKHGVRKFIFFSTQSIYGKVPGSTTVSENSPKTPLTTYAKSKYLAEEAVKLLADRSFSPIFIRPSTVYGLSPKLRCDIVLNNLVGWAATVGSISLQSDGSPWRPIVHVKDLVNAVSLILAADRKATHNQAFNIGEEVSYQIKEMVSLIQKRYPKVSVTKKNISTDERSYKVSSKKFLNTFNFQFSHNMIDGIKELYDGYVSKRLTQQAFKEKYVRVAQIQSHLGHKLLTRKLFWQL